MALLLWAPAQQPMAPPLEQRLRRAAQDAVALPVVAALHGLKDLQKNLGKITIEIVSCSIKNGDFP